MKNSEKGSVPVIFLVLALAVVLGVILIQNPTNFLPKAARTKPPVSSPITPTPTPTLTMQGKDGTWCIDSDGKDNYAVAGYCQDKQGTYQDSCQIDSARDYYCTGTLNGKKYNKVHCAYLSNSCSASGKLCQNGACVNPPTPTPTATPTPTPTFTPTPPPPTPTPQAAKRVFITSTSYNGNLGGLSGADNKCQTSANAAGLGGTWRVWLSDSQTSAASRVIHTTGGYTLINGVKMANSWTDLISGRLSAPPNITELGTVKNAPWVWTHSLGDGSIYYGDNNNYPCANWTSSNGGGSTGDSSRTDSGWTYYGGNSCYNYLPLYCFEQ